MVTYSCPNYNGGLDNPSLKLGPGGVITLHLNNWCNDLFMAYRQLPCWSRKLQVFNEVTDIWPNLIPYGYFTTTINKMMIIISCKRIAIYDAFVQIYKTRNNYDAIVKTDWVVKHYVNRLTNNSLYPNIHSYVTHDIKLNVLNILRYRSMCHYRKLWARSKRARHWSWTSSQYRHLGGMQGGLPEKWFLHGCGLEVGLIILHLV